MILAIAAELAGRAAECAPGVEPLRRDVAGAAGGGGGGGAWDLFNNPLALNMGKKALSVSAFEGTTQAAAAYSRASLYTILGRPIWGDRSILVAANPTIEKGITSVGMVGLAAKDLIGAPPGSLRGRLFGARRSLFEQAVLRNSKEVTIKVIVDHQIKYGHRLPMGRVAGWLAGSGKYLLDAGIGLGVDVGFQAWMDYGNPYLSREQFTGRVMVTGFGSLTSFGVGTAAGYLSGLSTIGVLGGPAGWVAIGIGISTAIIWDIWIAPQIYKSFGLNPERNLAPLQP